MIEEIGKTDMDSGVRDFLHDMLANRAKEHKKTLRQVAQAVVFMSRLRGTPHQYKSMDEAMESRMSGDLQEELRKVSSITDFDVFKLDSLSNHHPLRTIALSVIRKQGLMTYFNVLKFQEFVDKVESKYSDRPYHNRMHAADVTQLVHVVLLEKRSKFSELHLVAALFATMCHDVGHPGVSNAFHVNMADDLAITYNDRSINENMHSAMAYRTLQEEGCQCFEPLSREQYAAVRKVVVECILGTDMAVHFDNMKIFRREVEQFGPDPVKWDSPELALHWVVHSLDIASTARQFSVADRWTDLLMQEFFEQGDRERELGMTISPLCDRNMVSRASAQVGFINFIVRPSFDALSQVYEVDEALQNLDSYVAEYTKLLAQEKAAQEEKKEGKKPEAAPPSPREPSVAAGEEAPANEKAPP